MDNSTYIFDTNMFSNLIRRNDPDLLKRIWDSQDAVLILCDPVIYELERGLLHKDASTQLVYFREQIIPLFTVVAITLVDWRVAALLWAEMRRQGKQLSNIDLLIAAVTLRVDAVLVTADDDFDALPIKREN